MLKRKGSIKRSLIVAMVSLAAAISLLCGGSLGGVLYLTESRAMEERVTEGVKAYRAAVQEAIEVFKARVEGVAGTAELSDSGLGQSRLESLRAELAQRYGFEDVNIINSQGIASDGLDLSGREYFQRAIQGETNISSTLVSAKTGEVILILCARVNNGTGYEGCVLAQLSSDTFSQMIDEVSIGKSGYGFITDREGVVLAHPDRTQVNEFANYKTLAQSDSAYSGMAGVVEGMISGETGSRQADFEGRKLHVGYAPIEGADGWSLAVAADQGELLEGFYEGVVIVSILTAVFIALSVVAAVMIANPIASPIVALVKRIEGLSKGDLHTPVPQVKTRGEIGVLAASFTDTVDILSAYVGEISQLLDSLAEGDCTVSAVQDYRGDFASIKVSLDTIILNLNRIFRETGRSADQVASGSGQVAASAQALAQGATEQATAVEELSASVSSIRGDVESTARNAAEVRKLSRQAMEEVAAGDEQTRRLMEAMEEISGASSQIGKIIKTIDDIAFQTNILALNAAVEAARAGSSGKGFAVVAQEVRSLAGKSAEAAKNTSELINNSLQAVARGGGVAKATESSLQLISGTVKQTAGLIEQISAAAEDQASAIRQITTGVEQISAVVQTNSATSEESAAASEEMSAQAYAMKQTMAFLKLREEGADSRQPVVQEKTARPALPVHEQSPAPAMRR